MTNFAIGTGALEAVQKALDVVGNNIANAGTEGYHRQRIDMRPAPSMKSGTIVYGTGVVVEDVTRMIDRLLEEELLRQQSLLEYSDTELSMLKMVESVLGELSSEEGGLSKAIDSFFNSMKDLSAHPKDAIWQNQVINDADAMAGQFRTVGEYLTTLETQIHLEAENVVESINSLTAQIADVNDNIERVEVLGGTANSMRDDRDMLVTKLAELVSVETTERKYGVVDISISGMPVVMGSSITEMEVGYDDNGKLGISAVGANNYMTSLTGGRLGGLLSLENSLIDDVRDEMDTLASTIIQEINQLHVQGVGSAGSFTALTGWTMASETLSDFDPAISDGSIFIRVTNTSTGAVTRNEVAIDVSADTMASVAADISAITGLTASVTASQLNILADANYTFDFLPSVLSSPTASSLTGTSPPTVTVSGIYDGTTNQTLTFTVSGTDSVGNGNLQLSVTDGGGASVAVLDVGSGYAAGDLLELGNGIKITLGTGDLANGDTFEIDVYGDTDTSDFLSAVGINTFFSGNAADDIAVVPVMANAPSRIAAILGADMTDNANALRMADIGEQTFTALGSLTCGDYYRKAVTDLGQLISVKQTRQDSMESTLQNLMNHRSEMSGVDINEEAAQLMIFEQMFQSIAKYLMTVKTTMDTVMAIF